MTVEKIVIVLLCLTTIDVRCLPAAEPPDLTADRAAGAEIDRTRTYNLGATGMRGWIHTAAETYFDGVQGRTTTASRQILVTHVGKDTPADGMIEPGDVILGVAGQPFTSDARRTIAVAVQAAEAGHDDGRLQLTRWRKGRVAEVLLTLRVLGAYAPTAPFDCAKSRQILDDACAVLAREPLTEDLWGAISGLALLASDRPEFLTRVAEFARDLAHSTPRAVRGDMRTWECGYRGVFLAEYFLLTGDRGVLPAIEMLTRSLARGQGMYGTFGHGFCEPAADGGPHGSIPPYGPVNAAGLVANLAIVLGRECGVTDEEVAAAVDRGSRFFAYYVDKGSIPYGEHAAFPYHENNGKNAMAAVFFAAQGSRAKEARFFAAMVTAAYRNRAYGHTGQGFSYLWSGLGANVGGRAAAAAHVREVSWHLDLARRCDGSFTYDGDEQFGAGRTEDDTYFGASRYYGLSPTAAHVLTYAIPLATLRITGRGATPEQLLTDEEVAAAVVSGRFDTDRLTLPADALLEALGDWSPVVRGWAAEELARRPAAAGLVPRLVAMAEGPDPRRRESACIALGELQAAEGLPVLVRLLVDDDRWLRTRAAAALAKFGTAARPALPQLLEAMARTEEPAVPIPWSDPLQLAQGQLAATLFNGLLRQSIDDVDRRLLHPAIRAVSRNADGMARTTLVHLLENQLTADDVAALGADLLTAVTKPCPADTMFRDQIRTAAFKVLARHRYREAIDAGVTLARTQGGHGSESRTGEIMKELVGYGAAARGVLPRLEGVIEHFRAQVAAGGFPEGPLNDRRIAAVREAIAAIGAAESAPPLRSFR